ncbi:RNA methyltransferase [Marinicellulosiphila megalodicopiae]|uniref:RNA methyltransferase n=1 Tax=Marinicellulosiphila megalodicopiae TaxID=2724896 RepID=UPI003BAF3CF6
MNRPKSTIVLCNPKSPSNVGAVMRAAGCYASEAIYYTGDRFERAQKYQQDTKNHSQTIPLNKIENIQTLKTSKSKIVCIELVEGAIALPDFKHPEQAIYVFGPEDGSIDLSIVKSADHVVYIPTIGCMNLAATTNVVLYDRMAKQKKPIDHDALIKKSRDVNNHLKIDK